MRSVFQVKHNDTSAEDLDDSLYSLLNKDTDIEKCIDDFSKALITACSISFNRYRTTKKTSTHKTVPWWSIELTVLRKRTNTLCRLYQRTKNNDKLGGMRKNILKVKQHTQLL